MKKILFLLTIVSFFSFSVYTQEVTLRYKLKPGISFVSEAEVHTSMNQKVMGINQEIKMDMSMTLTGKVKSEKNRIYTIDYQYKNIKITTTSPAYTVNIDTEGPETPQNKMLSVLVGKNFTVFMDDRGRITDVRGLQNIFEDIDTLTSIDENTRQQYKASLEETFSKDFFLQNFEQSSVFYPEESVRPGQSWRYSFSSTSSNVSLNLKNTATLKEATGKMFLVRVASVIDTPPNDTIMVDGNSGQISMTGHQISEVRIDRSTGLVTESNVSQSIKGKLVLNGLRESDGPMEIPMSMTSKIYVNLTIKR